MPEATGHTLGAYERRGDLELGRGDVISTGDLAALPGDYPVYSSSAVGDGVFGRYGRHMFDEELITWSIDGGGRPFHRRKHRFSVTNVCGFLRIKRHDRWDYGYLHAILEKLQSGIQFDYQMKAHPSVIRDLYRFDCVPIDEQRAIAAVRDTLDTTIRQTEAIIQKLKQVKQGLLHDLLTRGIDANGELRPPQSQAPHRYKDSPLGWMPKEWTVRKLGEVSASMTNGFVGTALPHYSEAGDSVPYLYGNNVRPNAVDISSCARVSARFHRQQVKSRLAPGDVLTVQSGHIGTTAVVPPGLGEANCHALIIMRLARPDHLPDYIACYCNSALGLRDMSKLFVGSTIPHINVKDFKNFLIPLPDDRNEQRATCAALERAQRRIHLEDQDLAKLRVVKSGLMDDLLTGRVRVTPLLA